MIQGWKSIISRIYFMTVYKNKNVVIKRSAFASRNSFFEGYNIIHRGTIFSGKIGYASIIGENCKVVADIGRFTSIGANVHVESFSHPTSTFVSTHPAFYSLLKQAGFTYVSRQKYSDYKYYKDNIPIVIGNDVWIGSDVTIIGGVSIGDGSIVAAGAVVTKNVEPYSIVGGVPAKLIRYRFSKEDIEFLQKIKWWNKPVEWIRKNAELFDDIDKLKEGMRNESL